MPTVVHVGPISSPGGIQTVIETLSSNPPDGWTVETIESHSSGSYFSKLQAYNHAKNRLEELGKQNKDGLIVHLHAASDYSFLRKLRLAEHVHRHGGKIVFHIHSGNIVSWLGKKDRAKKLKQRLENCKATIVCLSDRWKELITPFLGKCIVSPNPIDPMHCVDKSVERNPNQILLLGRNDPVKGHEFAFQIMNELKHRGSEMTLHCTGREEAPQGSTNIVAHGWVTKEEKVKMLQESSLLLLPSAYEGQPMVALEALACGTAVLASKALHSLPDVIHQPDEETVKSWADAIEQIRTTKLELSDTLYRHSVESINERLLSLYQGLIQSMT
ncbi:MAG: glycosyltransferase family 4 protein [Candidatus Thermoplasmatota archaeon]|nr:glycosyltransferase family 4 protein [Candidatus Thermoplasmatota archaeon]